MAKKKKGKKGKKNLKTMTLQQLLEKAKVCLSNQKARDAVSLLKAAVKNHGLTDELKQMLFNAYLMREEQLRSKHMESEADMVKHQAFEFMPSVESISEDDMVLYVHASSVNDAFQTYKKYLSTHKPSLKIEQCLANHLLRGRGFEIIARLDNASMIKRDFEPIPKAVDWMNQGKWENALAELQPVPRISPFAPMRMFCRAMVCFLNNDDESALKALSMIPDHFALADTVRNMKIVLSKNSDKSNQISAQKKIHCLWECPPDFNSYGKLLYESLEKKNFSQSRELIIEIAEIINPENPVPVVFFILEIIWTMVRQNKIEEYQFAKLIKNILPKNYSELLATKISLQETSLNPIKVAGHYISILDTEFPDPEKRKTAHAQILFFVVNLIFKKNNLSQLKKEKSNIEQYKDVMGIKSSDPELILIEIMMKSIKLDPLNKKAYELLVQLPRTSRAARNMMDSVLTAMLKKFPDDPFPCLELASIYYENHAFRKAENILAEAMKRAPHDNRVIDRNVLALLISSDKNIDRKKLHLVERDIGKAEELDSKKIWPFIAAKKIVFKLIDPENINSAEKSKKPTQFSLFAKEDPYYTVIIDNELDKLPLFEQLRAISVLIPEVKTRDIKLKNQAAQYLEKIFEKKLKNVSSLSSSQIIALLAPLGKEFAPIVETRNMALMFLKASKDILNKISNAEIIPLYDLIFQPDVYSFIKADINKRLKSADKRIRILLQFYLVILQHIIGEKKNSALFYDIIDQVEDTPIEKELEAMASRMAKYASGTLRFALTNFDFDILDERFFPFRFPGNNIDDLLPRMPYFDDDDDDDDDDDYDDVISGLNDIVMLLGKAGLINPDNFEEETNKLINSVESFIDSIDVRGMPGFMIKEIRSSIIRMKPNVKHEIESMAAMIDSFDARSRLSKEAQLVLFGNIQKKNKK